MPNRIQARQVQQVQNAVVRGPDLGPAILASLKAIRDNPSGRTVGEQATELARALREAGVQSNGWEHYLLLNFKKTVTGEDPNALAYFKTNMTRAADVMGRGDVNRALTLATTANRAVVKDNGVDVKAAQQWMGKIVTSDAPMTQQAATNIAVTLRNAGFSDDAKKTGLELARVRKLVTQPNRYGTLGMEALRRDVTQLLQLTAKAARQGVIDKATQGRLTTLAAAYEKFFPKSQAEVAQINQQREVQRQVRVNSPELAPYRQLAEDVKYLRDTLASRNGSMWGSGSYQKNAADQLIRQLPRFEQVLATGKLDDVKRFVEANLGDRPKGMTVRQWADQITETDQQHQKIFSAGHTIIEQFGPVPYAASKILSNVMKGQRENLPLETVAYNTMIDLVSYAAGKGYAGKVGGMANEAMLDFARSAAADIAKDPSPAGIGKAMINGFKSAVLGIGGKALKELSPEERKDLAKRLYDLGTKLFDGATVKPIINDLFK